MGRDGRGVRAVSESSIEITFMYQGARCRERIALKPTASNLRLAEQHKAAIELSIANGTFDYAVTFPNSKRAIKFAPLASQQKLKDYLPAWLETRRKHLKASTYIHYERMVNNQLIPWFGDFALVELTRRHIKEKLITHKGGNSSLSNLQSCLRRALSDAVDDEILETNPLAGWKFKTKDSIKEDDDVDPFTPEEQAAILAAVRDDLKAQVQFSLWTGLRPCELIALEWGDVDWIAGEIRIVRSKTRAAKTPEAPKTTSGRRTIKLLAPAKEALLRQKAVTFLAGERVFLHPNTGEPWADSEQVRRVAWMHAIKKSGVRYRRPYQTRHTYASMMLSAGEHPMWVAKQMGHKDWTMIARIYGRWMPTADASAGSRAVQLFGGNANVMTASAMEAAS